MGPPLNLHGALRPVHLELGLLHLLLAHFLLLGLGRRLVEGLLLLDEHNLDVARRAHVRVDATVGAVRAAPHVRGTVHLQVKNSHQNLLMKIVH